MNENMIRLCDELKPLEVDFKGNVGEIMDNVREASVGLRAFTDQIQSNPSLLLRSSTPEQLDETR